MALTDRENAALQDPDVRFGFDNSEVLQKLGEFVRTMRSESSLSQQALQARSGISQADISRLESAAMDKGPLLMTLVRLARASNHQLVIGLKNGQTQQITQLLEL